MRFPCISSRPYTATTSWTVHDAGAQAFPWRDLRRISKQSSWNSHHKIYIGISQCRTLKTLGFPACKDTDSNACNHNENQFELLEILHLAELHKPEGCSLHPLPHSLSPAPLISCNCPLSSLARWNLQHFTHLPLSSLLSRRSGLPTLAQGKHGVSQASTQFDLLAGSSSSPPFPLLPLILFVYGCVVVSDSALHVYTQDRLREFGYTLSLWPRLSMQIPLTGDRVESLKHFALYILLKVRQDGLDSFKSGDTPTQKITQTTTHAH